MATYKRPPFAPLVSTADRMKVFGSFEYSRNADNTIRFKGAWAKENIIQIEIPQLVGISGAPASGKIWVHRLVAEQFRGFFEAVEHAGLLPLILSWGGSFVPRLVRGGNSLSNHAFGTAFDINAAWNGMGREPAARGKTGSVIALLEIAYQYGFYWGGLFSRKDGMHFEIAVVGMSPGQAATSGPASDDLDISPDVATIDAPTLAAPEPVSPEQSSDPGALAEKSEPAAGSPSIIAQAGALISTPDSPARKILTGNTGAIAKPGSIAAILFSIWQWVETHPGLVVTIIVAGTVIFLACHFREFLEKRVEALINGDPHQHNVEFVRKPIFVRSKKQ